jgi:hypothetical protein
VLLSWTAAVAVFVSVLAVWQLRVWRREQSKAAGASAAQQQQHREKQLQDAGDKQS